MEATATNTVEELAEQARRAVDQAADRAADAQALAAAALEDAVAYIREHPLPAVGIAAAAGFVLALLIRR